MFLLVLNTLCLFSIIISIPFYLGFYTIQPQCKIGLLANHTFMYPVAFFMKKAFPTCEIYLFRQFQKMKNQIWISKADLYSSRFTREFASAMRKVKLNRQTTIMKQKNVIIQNLQESSFSLVLKYGLSQMSVSKEMQEVQSKLKKVYKILFQGQSFIKGRQLLKRIDPTLYRMTKITYKQYFIEKGIDINYIDQILYPQLTYFFKQRTQFNSLGALLALFPKQCYQINLQKLQHLLIRNYDIIIKDFKSIQSIEQLNNYSIELTLDQSERMMVNFTVSDEYEQNEYETEWQEVWVVGQLRKKYQLDKVIISNQKIVFIEQICSNCIEKLNHYRVVVLQEAYQNDLQTFFDHYRIIHRKNLHRPKLTLPVKLPRYKTKENVYMLKVLAPLYQNIELDLISAHNIINLIKKTVN